MSMEVIEMYVQSSRSIRQGFLGLIEPRPKIIIAQPVDHADRVKSELRNLGMTKYGLFKMEAKYLPKIINKDEHIKGIVYGLCKDSSALIAATDRRVIYLDKKPMFADVDEISYNVVSGIQKSEAGLGISVTLHTRIKDYQIRTLNKRTAIQFVNYIESQCLRGRDMYRPI